MKQIILAALMATAAFASSAAAQGSADLARISAYLNGLRTAEGNFTQTNPDGSISKGHYYINKPGRMRFEYEAPQPALVIADSVSLGVIDLTSDAEPQNYPLSQTPMDILLRDRVDLSKEGTIRGIQRRDGYILVTAIDRDRPEIGAITMTFTDRPLQLVRWVVAEPNGNVTVVDLGEMERGGTFDRKLFSIPYALLQRDG